MVYKIQIRTLIEVFSALQKIQTELTGLEKALINRSEIYICTINEENRIRQKFDPKVLVWTDMLFSLNLFLSLSLTEAGISELLVFRMFTDYPL